MPVCPLLGQFPQGIAILAHHAFSGLYLSSALGASRHWLDTISIGFRRKQDLLVEPLPLFPCNAKSKSRRRITRDIGKSLILIKGLFVSLCLSSFSTSACCDVVFHGFQYL